MLLLLCVLLVPSVCLFWFMNQAMQNERFAVRQKLVDAYRVHLALAQDRLQTYWQHVADEPATSIGRQSASASFSREILAGAADSVVYFDATGQVVYPNVAVLTVPDQSDGAWAEARRLELRDPKLAGDAYGQIAEQSTNPNIVSRALLGQARCLIRAGSRPKAIEILTGQLADDRFRLATDAQGRLIQPNATWMALELLKDSAPEQARVIRERLQVSLLDYENVVMTAPQRRFLMRELQNTFPDTQAFPTLAAEDLAEQWVSMADFGNCTADLRASPLAGVWQIASSGKRIVTLHRTDNLIARLQAVVSQPELSHDVRIEFIVPGKENGDALLSMPAGAAMPGWHLALFLRDPRLFDAATNQRSRFYVWIGVSVIVTVIVLFALAWVLVRRQSALTQLRNDLVANVTHELKTPLASTRLLVETLLNTPKTNEQTVREYLLLIANENQRLSRLIDNFLLFSRIERNKYVFTFSPTSAATIAENAAAAVRERFRVPECRFDVTIGPDLPCLRCDADAMVTALVNLLENAWKYSGETKQIALTASRQDSRVVFSVRDNGIGLLARDTKMIFQRFYQVNQHLSPTGGGCGLGLSIVKFIVTAHRGTVGVESELGRGSTFTISLPADGLLENLESKS
jgi:signal transduction histidine kinase